MKKIYMLAILIILVILAGAYILSPFAPMNKVSFNGENLKLSPGYTVQNSTNDTLTISNGTNELQIINTKDDDLETAISKYEIQVNKDNNNLTKEELKTDNDIKVVRTIKNGTLTRYWFVNNNKVYSIRTTNPVSNTKNVVLDLISSMN